MNVRELISKLAAVSPELPAVVGREEIVAVQEIEQDGEKVAYLYREAADH